MKRILRKSVSFFVSFVMMITGLVPMMAHAATPAVSNAMTALSKDGVSARIGIVSDTHINKHNGETLASNPAAQKLDTALKTFNAQNVDGIAMNGDIVYMVNSSWGTSTIEDLSEIPYSVLKETLEVNGYYDSTNGLAENVVYSTGNHEFPQNDDSPETSAASREMFKNQMGIEPERDVVISGYHFITAGGSNYQSYMSEDNMAWVLEKIDAAHMEDPNKPVFLMLHHPIHETVMGSNTEAKTRYSATFKEALNQRPYVIVFTAHIHLTEHNPKVVWQDGFTSIQTSAVGGGYLETEGADLAIATGTTGLHANSYSQGMMVDITTNNVVKIYRFDFSSGEIFGEPIEIDIAAGAEGFKYKTKTAAVPYFEAGAAMTKVDVGDNNIKVSFPKANVGAEGGFETEGFVNKYRVDVVKESSSQSISTKTYLSDYFMSPTNQKSEFELNVTGLEPAEGYTISVTPVSCLGGEGEAISLSAKTTGEKPPKEFITKELNVAQNKTVQDSASNASNPQYAVDGDMNTIWTPGEFKEGEKYHWLSIDLGREFNIKRIEIYDGGVDWGAHRKNIAVEGATKPDFSDAKTIDEIGNQETEKYIQNGCWNISLTDNYYRYIRIRRTDAQIWCPYFDEVKVFADVNLVELLKGKPAWASDSYNVNTHGPNNAVDGNEDTNWLVYCQGRGTGIYPYWYVDMGDAYSVDYIEYINTNTGDNETKRFFDIIGSNSPLTDEINADEDKFVSMDASHFMTFPYSSTVSSPEAYRYLGYRKTYDYGTANITELKAYTMAPDISDISLTDSGVTIRFSEKMKAETLNPNEIKIYDIASGNAIDYTTADYTFDGQTYTINKTLEPGKAYNITISNEVTSAKNSTFAETYSETIINGTLADYGNEVYEKRVLANVAQFKPVTTTINHTVGYEPEKANDGIVDESYWLPRDTFTGSEKYASWCVDLGRDYKIERIEIYDQGNNDGNHRKNIAVEGATKADFSDAVTIDSIANTSDDEKYSKNGCWTINVEDGAYRYIRVKKTGGMVTGNPFLREVKVFAEQTVTEVSRNKPVESDCEYNDIHAAEKANDGKNLTSTNSAWVRSWGTHTKPCWWRVDLGDAYYIDYFEIEDRVKIDNTRSQFELRGTNDPSTEDSTFASAQKLAYLGAKSGLHALQSDPFVKEGMWTSSASSNMPYRYIIWRSNNVNASNGLAEIRACVVNPEIYGFKAQDNKIDLTFSDNMLGITLSPETVKVFNSLGEEVEYSEYTVGEKTYSIDNIELEEGSKYTVEVLGGARNEKLVPVAKADNKKEFTYGKNYDIEYFETIDNVDADGANFGSLKPGEKFEAKANIFNYSGTQLNLSLITTLYKDGCLVGVDINNALAKDEKVTKMKSELTVPTSDAECYSAKAFLWDSENLTPLAPAKEGKMQNLFNTDVLNMIPSYTQTSETNVSGLTSIYYDALPYEGNATKVYAYYGIPEHKEGEKVPGVVLVHGGGGTAYSNWVKEWNERGYAAIAMDLGGNTPTDAYGNKYKHENAGPGQCTYEDLYKDIEDTWMYHAVANVMLAHNILRSFEDVDSSKIGISGVSWGGVVTTTTLGVDDRFAFAVPIYGCGHLYESETYFHDTLAPRSKYIDPAYYAQRSTLPILFVNDDTDYHFSTTITTKTYEDVEDHATITFLPETPHSQETAENMQEPYAFADSIVKGGIDLIKITSASVSDGNINVTYDVGEREVSEVYLRYNNDEVFTYAGAACTSTWESISGTADNGSITIQIPENCKHFYVNIVDTDGNTVSTKQFING